MLDPASLRQPVEAQHGTFVVASHARVPDRLRADRARQWRIHLPASGHWPMLERAEEVASLIAELAAREGAVTQWPATQNSLPSTS